MHISELNTQERYESALALLSSQRREKVLRIKPEEGRKLSLMAGLLLERALKEAGINEYEIEYRENSKPYLKGRDDIYFNLSHSKEMAICVLSPYEVGCDIEAIGEAREKIARRYFTQEEQEFVFSKENGFFRMWTLKESFLKVTGKGLCLNMADFSIDALPEEITVKQSVDGRKYTFAEVNDFAGYCCAVCLADAKEGSCIEKYY